MTGIIQEVQVSINKALGIALIYTPTTMYVDAKKFGKADCGHFMLVLMHLNCTWRELLTTK